MKDRGLIAALWQRHGAKRCIVPATILLLPVAAQAQLLDRYFPANVPAYQDWFATGPAMNIDDSYSPLGVRVGNLVIHADVAEGIGYDNNITGVSNGVGSAEVLSSGAVSLNSDWSRNGIDAALTVNDTRYLDVPSRSFTDWTASAGGVVQYADDEIRLGYSHLNAVTLPTDVGSFGINQPVIDQVDDLRLSDTIGPGPLILVPALVGDIYQFTPLSGGQSAASEDLFNRQALTASLTGGYEFAGGHNLIVIISDSEVGYSNSGTALRPEDYNDLSVVGGIEYRPSALFGYRVLAGYEQRFGAKNALSGGTRSSPAAELDLTWSPSALTTLVGRVTQGLQDEPTGIGQGLQQTTADLTLTHAVLRNVILQAELGYTRAAFPHDFGDQSSFIASADVTWHLSRPLSLELHYDFTDANDSQSSALSFTRHEVVLTAKFAL